MKAMKLLVLISGRGSNLQAILESPAGAAVAAVISDNPDAAGLEIAKRHGKPTHIVDAAACLGKKNFETRLQSVIEMYQPALIALAGFFRILSGDFINRYPRQIINIHPSLLPAFRGLKTHQRALEAGVAEHGCTVHWVSEEVDAGEIIHQQPVPVLPDDDEAALAARVLAAEHRLYPEVLSELLRREA